MSMVLKYGMKKRAKKMAMGGAAHQSECTENCTSPCDIHEMASGYEDHEANDAMANEAAMAEDDKDLNQSMVDRIMAKRKAYSEGGMVANEDQGLSSQDLDRMADGQSNEMDDLALRDDLHATIDSNSEAGFEQEDAFRKDFVARIMRSRAKKSLPNPR